MPLSLQPKKVLTELTVLSIVYHLDLVLVVDMVTPQVLVVVFRQ